MGEWRNRTRWSLFAGTAQWVCDMPMGVQHGAHRHGAIRILIRGRLYMHRFADDFFTELILREMAGPLISLYTSIALLHAPLSVPSLSRCPAPRCAEGDSLFSAFANLFKEDPDAAARKE